MQRLRPAPRPAPQLAASQQLNDASGPAGPTPQELPSTHRQANISTCARWEDHTLTEHRWKAEQEQQRREQAIANTTGQRVLAAIGSAVPVRLLKRDLLFVIERLMSVLDETRIETLARQHGIRQKRDDGGLAKTFAAFLRRADEGTLSRLLVESSILLAATRGNPSVVLKEAATAYKVDTDTIAAKVRQEFVAKGKAKKAPQPATKTVKKAA